MKPKHEHVEAVREAEDIPALNAAIAAAAVDLQAEDLADVVAQAERKAVAMRDVYRSVRHKIDRGMHYLRSASAELQAAQRKGKVV